MKLLSNPNTPNNRYSPESDFRKTALASCGFFILRVCFCLIFLLGTAQIMPVDELLGAGAQAALTSAGRASGEKNSHDAGHSGLATADINPGGVDSGSTLRTALPGCEDDSGCILPCNASQFFIRFLSKNENTGRSLSQSWDGGASEFGLHVAGPDGAYSTPGSSLLNSFHVQLVLKKVWPVRAGPLA